MYFKLKDLAERLEKEGRHNDSAIVYSAMVKFLPEPTPSLRPR